MTDKAKQHLAKTGFWGCTALAIANMVGTGVFTSLGFQLEELQSPLLILSLWAVGGIVAFCGAVSYAELSAMLPASGGEYHFLKEIYHPSLGFMAAVVSTGIGFSAPVALAAMAFGKYLHAAFPAVPAGASGAVAIAALTLAHASSVRASSFFQVSVTGINLALIGCFLIAGATLGSAVPLAPQPGDASRMLGGAYAVSLMYVMYSYWGWNASAYITGEAHNPKKTVPAALLTATAIVAVLYVSLNAVFLAGAPSKELAGKIEVGTVVANHLLGDAGGRAMSVVIAVGLLAAMSAMTWAGPRVTQKVGADFPSLRWLGASTAGGVPRRALFVQTVIVAAYFVTGAFEPVLVYATFALTVCSSLAVLGVFVQRVRAPQLDRPFRCWGYPLTPAIYLVITTFMLAYSLTQKTAQAVPGCATLLLGLALYFPARRLGPAPERTPGSKP